jgi:hypothetical protein
LLNIYPSHRLAPFRYRHELALTIAGTQMTNDELKQMIRRNQMLGMWAAEKLGLVGQQADAYARNLAVGTLDPDQRDVFSKLRNDFDAAGIVQSDEQILNVMNELNIHAADPKQGGAGPGGAAAVMIARKLSSRP